MVFLKIVPYTEILQIFQNIIRIHGQFTVMLRTDINAEVQMNLEHILCALTAVSRISHIAEQLSGPYRVSRLKFLCICRQMGIIKIASVRASYADPVASFGQSANLFHGSVRHTEDRVKMLLFH